MKPVRPFRAHSVYAADCIDCHQEIESPTLPVPLRCRSCQAKLPPAPQVKAPCRYNHATLALVSGREDCPECGELVKKAPNA